MNNDVRRRTGRKWKAPCFLASLGLFLSACAPGAVEKAAPQAAIVPPTEYPAVPSASAAVDARLVESPALMHLDMLDERNGWGVSEAQIVRTDDGGSTWYDVTPRNLSEAGNSVDTFVLDDAHAWVLKPDFEKYPHSGLLYRTSDGGSTWKSSTVPFSRGDLKFLNENNGWMLADLGVGAGSNAVAVYQTTDGGASWEQTYTNDPNDAEAADSLPLGGLKTDLVPIDMQTAWITGVVYAPGEIYLYRTDDSGHTWTPVPVTLPAGTQNDEIGIDRDQMKFVSPADGFLALHVSGEAMQTAVYVTQDAGKTWAVPSQPLDGAGASAFVSPKEAVIYNGKQFYVTHDAGRTWVTVMPDTTFGDILAGMDFVDTSTGWVLTSSAANHRSLYKTTDGGTTWSAVIP